MTVKWEIAPQTLAACLSHFYRIAATDSASLRPWPVLPNDKPFGEILRGNQRVISELSR
jgi:hypothetical protein